MNLLLDAPPDYVEVHGQPYMIRPDYRTAISFSMLMTDPEIEEEAKLPTALSLFYFPLIPADVEEAVRKMVWFYRGGTDRGNSDQPRSSEDVFSYEHDADLIYAAFWQQYGIDLHQHPDLHWWKFRALFSALGEETELHRVMGYRAMEITPDMTKKQKEFYQKMKRLYRIPVSRTEQAKQNKLEELLMNGGDTSEIEKLLHSG